MAKRYRKNPTARELAEDVVYGDHYIPDFLKELASELERRASSEEDEDLVEALDGDALTLRNIVKKHGREFSE